jgi:hypothetical protein
MFKLRRLFGPMLYGALPDFAAIIWSRVIAALSLRYRCVIAALSLRYRCVIAALSLRYRCVIV